MAKPIVKTRRSSALSDYGGYEGGWFSAPLSAILAVTPTANGHIAEIPSRALDLLVAKIQEPEGSVAITRRKQSNMRLLWQRVKGTWGRQAKSTSPSLQPAEDLFTDNGSESSEDEDDALKAEKRSARLVRWTSTKDMKVMAQFRRKASTATQTGKI
jgi:hypothetical protein